MGQKFGLRRLKQQNPTAATNPEGRERRSVWLFSDLSQSLAGRYLGNPNAAGESAKQAGLATTVFAESKKYPKEYSSLQSSIPDASLGKPDGQSRAETLLPFQDQKIFIHPKRGGGLVFEKKE